MTLPTRSSEQPANARRFPRRAWHFAIAVAIVAVFGIALTLMKGSRYGKAPLSWVAGDVTYTVTTSDGVIFSGYLKDDVVVYRDAGAVAGEAHKSALEIWINGHAVRLGEPLPAELLNIHADRHVYSHDTIWRVRRGRKEARFFVKNDGTIGSLGMRALYERDNTPGIRSIRMKYRNTDVEAWPLSDDALEELIGSDGTLDAQWVPQF